ncbi:MAG TPA: hypothetical protein VGJ81_13765 [Thermoanaerobaculia bacterium]
MALVTAAGAPPIMTRSFVEIESKFVPLIVTLVPAGPCAGVNELIAGGRRYVNPDARVPDPPGVVTVTFATPAVPAGVVAVSEVGETTTTFDAVAPPRDSVVPPASKFEPVTVMVSPPLVFPRFGEIAAIVGGARYVNAPVFVPLPVGVVTVMSTVPAGWAGDETVSVVAFAKVTVAAAPPKLTLVLLAVPKLVPVIVTVSPPPVRPRVGCTAVIVGVARIVRVAEPLTEPRVPRIVTVPALRPVARLVVSILARPVSLEAQVTLFVRFFVLPSEYVPLAVNACFAPMTTVAVDGATAID